MPTPQHAAYSTFAEALMFYLGPSFRAAKDALNRRMPRLHEVFWNGWDACTEAMQNAIEERLRVDNWLENITQYSILLEKQRVLEAKAEIEKLRDQRNTLRDQLRSAKLENERLKQFQGLYEQEAQTT